jgi:hypothetical protein
LIGGIAWKSNKISGGYSRNGQRDRALYLLVPWSLRKDEEKIN